MYVYILESSKIVSKIMCRKCPWKIVKHTNYKKLTQCLLALQGLREEIGSLNHRIDELESQNCALTSMLVHQLRSDTPPPSELEESAARRLALEGSSKNASDDNNASGDASPVEQMKTSLNVKHCNSFNSDILETNKSESNCDNIINEAAISKIEKHLSADSDILGMKLTKYSVAIILVCF